MVRWALMEGGPDGHLACALQDTQGQGGLRPLLPRDPCASRQEIPGLRRYEISDGTVAGPEGPSNIHLVALLHFDSVDAIKAAIGTPDGQAAAGDLSNFADGGVDLMFIDTKPA